jgi:serine/threonine protein phosphatase PrpC
MRVAKDGIRSKVRIGFDGRVHKTFRGTDADKRYANEIRVLRVLEERGCDFVPRLLDRNDATLTIVTTNCGKPAEQVSEAKATALFEELQRDYRVVHDDPFPRNLTYHASLGRFCVIDFELATVLDDRGELAAPPLAVEWVGLSHSGSRKKKNEDSLSVFASEEGWARELDLDGAVAIENDGIVFAVSDGMGGSAGGGWASWLAVTELRRFLPAEVGRFELSAEPLRDLTNAVFNLNLFVNRVADAHPEVSKMGATLVCGLFSRRQMHFAHVGDSRIYRFYDGELEQLTFDDSRVGKMFREGKINEREARTHPARNLLTQVIGNQTRKIRPQVGSISLKPDMWFIFCSDGLIDGLWTKRIQRELAQSQEGGRTVGETAEILLNEAIDTSGKDDTTLFVIRVATTESFSKQ